MKDNEIAGTGNHNTALYWEYDTRIGRRWNLDPKPNISQSSYSVFNGNPIANIDRLGDVGEPVVKDGQLTIYSHIIFYGGAATPKIANQAAANIQSQWTNANGTVSYKGKEYHNVMFVVTSEVVSERQATMRAASNKGDNYDPRLNFARVESKSNLPPHTLNRVVGGFSGDNSMFLLAEDIYAGSTTQSHEMGHGFGLARHIANFEPFPGVPRVMTTVNTLVDAPYTLNGKASVSQGKGVKPANLLDRDCRQVTQEDISGMNVEDYNKRGQSNGLGNGSRVGSSTNILFNGQGVPLREPQSQQPQQSGE